MRLFRKKSVEPHLGIPHTPPKPSRFIRIIKGVLPLLFIALGVYVFYNFPAIKDRVAFTINKPKVGDTRLLPPTLRTQGPIPVARASECGKPISFDANGNPKQICDNYIYIPRIRVGAPIIYPSQTSDNVINDALLKGVIHYPGTAEPGQKGNVFITGHSSFYWWVKSDYKTVFTLVPEMVNGDEVIVYHKGIRYIYKVDDIREVLPTDVSVLRPTDKPVITLSTCVPVGTAYRRKIVRASQISPDPATARAGAVGEVTTGRLPGVR